MDISFKRGLRRLSLFLPLCLYSSQRLPQSVIVDFQRIGIKLSGYNPTFLANYPQEKYSVLLNRLQAFKGQENFDEVLVDSHYGLGTIEIDKLEDAFLRAQIVGTVLDLRDLTGKYFDYYSERGDGETTKFLYFPVARILLTDAPRTVDRILDAIAEAQSSFEQIIKSPHATADTVFHALDEAKEQLGIANVVIYRPLEAGKWICTHRTRQWTNSPSRYAVEGNGAEPETTLKSILDSKQEIVVVDFDDPASLSAARIEADPTFFPDASMGKGSGKAVIVKMQDAFDQPLAVVLLHNRVKLDETMDAGEILPDDLQDARRVLTALRLYFKEASDAIAFVTERTEPKGYVRDEEEDIHPFSILIPRASALLTDDLRFNPNKPFPKTPEDYHIMMREICGANGVFPDDTEPLTPEGTFTRRGAAGVNRGTLDRRGKRFDYEVFAPHLLARGAMGRFIFDADLMTKMASAVYGTPDVTYDRRQYYEGRLFHADVVPIIRYLGWPIAFSAMQGYKAPLEVDGEDRELYYAFIHFVMTNQLFQKYGLTSWAIRDGMTTLFLRDILRHEPNWILDKQGRLTDTRWTMWACAHSGRYTPFYAYVKGFADVPEGWDQIPAAMFADVHRRITPAAEITARGMPQFRGIQRVNGGCFPIAMDPGVYEPRTRYAVRDGQVQFPASEKEHSSPVIRQAWLDAIGGEEGVANGNSLYFGGLVNIWRIYKAIMRERAQEQTGLAGLLERGAERVRGGIVKRLR